MNWERKYYAEYWAGTKLAYPHVAAEAGKFARSEVVGNLVFVSGCEGLNPQTAKVETDVFEEQMWLALDKIRSALEETGSSMNNVVKTLILLKDIGDYKKMRKTELEYYQKHAPFLVDNPPASTVMQVATLARPNFLVEIEVVGILK